MRKKLKIKDGVSALSSLSPINYDEINKDLSDMYERLQKGRDAFASVYNLNVDAVAQISSLDLEIKFYIEQLLKIAQNVEDSSTGIYNAAADATQVAGIVSERHEDLTNTIMEVSESSANVLDKIETGQNELTYIRELSNSTIQLSETMHHDMKNLENVISEMTKVIDGINAISSQTNLLSLNASIEAARASEAGRGFAVVADEIRSLADETQNLTATMGEFVQGVRAASSKSAESVEKAIDALRSVNDKITDVWKINEENEKHVADITDSISNLAAFSEEISSSMIEIEARSSEIEESCKTLSGDATTLNSIANSSENALKPLTSIETDVDHLLKEMGKMSIDPFHALTNAELISYLDKAIVAHKNWLSRLEKIVKTHSIVPFQVDGNKCHFGHFYNSVEPPIAELKQIWSQIGVYHKELHKHGNRIIQCLFDENYGEAEKLFDEAKTKSENLIGLLDDIKTMIPEKSSNF